MNEEPNTGIVFGDDFDSNLVDTGDYEMLLSAEKRTTPTGKEKISLRFKIRSDVDQKFKGKSVFDDLWRDKENPLWFDLIKQNKLVKTQKGLPGYKNSFKNQDELLLYLNGLQMIVSVVKEYDEYSDSDKNKVKYLGYRPTEHYSTTPNGEGMAPATSKNLETIQVSDADLPF